MPKGAMLALYLIGYGMVRFFIEYFREPDAHLGFVFFSFSMGQVLCALMIAAGIALYISLWKFGSDVCNYGKRRFGFHPIL